MKLHHATFAAALFGATASASAQETGPCPETVYSVRSYLMHEYDCGWAMGDGFQLCPVNGATGFVSFVTLDDIGFGEGDGTVHFWDVFWQTCTEDFDSCTPRQQWLSGGCECDTYSCYFSHVDR